LEQLKKQMEEKSKKQDGPPLKPGEGKPGSQGEKGNEGANGMQPGEKGGMSSEQIAKIAAQQAAIRNALKELEKKSNQPDKSGKKPLGNDLGDLIKKMEQTEKDLVNKRFYNEMLQRQKEIEVKLLEAAKAEREQDEEKKRESESSKDIPKPIPPALKKYLEEKKENENAPKKNPVGLTPFYKSLVEKYYQLIK
jgi:5'-3' exonuclease